jgi:prepilin-type N-terminal cleavage/methylation domain-containing protein
MRLTAHGFTLIEAMVVVGIIGILATLAVGMSGNWRERQLFNEASREVYNALTTARSDAQVRGAAVVVTIEPNRVRAFRDANGNHVYDATEALVYLYPPDGSTFPAGVTLSAPSLTSVGTVRTTQFDARGFAVNPSDSSSFKGGSVVVTDSVLALSRTVDFTLAGAVRISH